MDSHKQPKIDHLTQWEWETLVGAWRYYEYRQTIVSTAFPGAIVRRFWQSGAYADSVQRKIANQFANIDHGRLGEADWADLPDVDRAQWTRFFAFCKGVCDGFHVVICKPFGRRRHKIVCFLCETTGTLHPVDEYIKCPALDCHFDPLKVVRIETAKAKPRAAKR